MSLTIEKKAAIIKDYGRKERDTGSPEVQIALLTTRILLLQEHFKAHRKDHHSRWGLIRMVNRRRRLLAYLKSRAPERYQKVIKNLKLRR